MSDRTIRNDIARLRDLGYPVDAVRGAAGHYRLGVGAKLPPLLLDDEEAVAVAVGLRAGHGVAGIEEASGRALAKLEQVLPHRLRRRVGALHEATSQGPENTASNVDDPQVDADVLASTRRRRPRPRAGAARPPARRRVADRRRAVPPGQLAAAVVPGRAGRGSVARAAGRPGDPADADAPTLPPGPDAGGGLHGFRAARGGGGGLGGARADHGARARGGGGGRINPTVGVVESVDDTTSVLVTGADSLEVLAVYIGMLGLEFRVHGPLALVEHLRALGERYLRAIGRSR